MDRHRATDRGLMTPALQHFAKWVMAVILVADQLAQFPIAIGLTHHKDWSVIDCVASVC